MKVPGWFNTWARKKIPLWSQLPIPPRAVGPETRNPQSILLDGLDPREAMEMQPTLTECRNAFDELCSFSKSHTCSRACLSTKRAHF